MQLLASVLGCAAVGTVLWSEFVLKETGGWRGAVLLRLRAGGA
jgi:hypothetical protein